MSPTGVLNSHMMAAALVRLYGTDEQKQRHLPKLVTAGLGLPSLSEPCAGSDTRSLLPIKREYRDAPLMMIRERPQ
jgi:alkylation response protein AidB-like acyl-CoA dehydrogenase